MARRASPLCPHPGDPAEPDLRGHRRLPERTARLPWRAPGQRDGAGCAGHRQRAALAGRARRHPAAQLRARSQRLGPGRRRGGAGRVLDRGGCAQATCLLARVSYGRARPAGAVSRRGGSQPPATVGRPVAVEDLAPRPVTHKTDIGGVALGLATDEEISAAYERVTAAAARSRGTPSGEVLVTAMRTGGAEVLAGVTVDPGFGPVLAVGLGGVLRGGAAARRQPAGPAYRRRRSRPDADGAARSAPADRGPRQAFPPTWPRWRR